MNKVRRTFGGIMIMFTLILFSCKTSSIITKSAYYTETEKLSRLTNGMDVQQVNKMLEIEPYDVYFASDGCKILAYQYRLKYRKYKASLKKEGFNNETSQRAGIEYYDKPNMAYVYFVDDKMTSVITDEGLKEGAYIVTENNILKSISKNELVSFDKRAGLYKEGQVWEIVPQKGLKRVSDRNKLNAIFANNSPKSNVPSVGEFDINNGQTSVVNEVSSQNIISTERTFGVNLSGLPYKGLTRLGGGSSEPLKLGIGFNRFRFANKNMLGWYHEFDMSYAHNKFDTESLYHSEYRSDEISVAYYVGPAYKVYQSDDKKINLNVFVGIGGDVGYKEEENYLYDGYYDNYGGGDDLFYDFDFAAGAYISYNISDNFGFYAKAGSGSMYTVQAGITWKVQKDKTTKKKL